MKSELQTQLLEELIDLQRRSQPYLDESWVQTPVERYFDERHFQRELQLVFRRQPVIAMHASEVAQPGDFKRIERHGRPLLIVRGQDGVVRAFFNVCRHRGAQLVSEEAGCSKRFSCPYHAWTWSNQGELIGVPHQNTGFPDLDRDKLGLQAVPCEEVAGWIWISDAIDKPLDVVGHLGALHSEVCELGAQRMKIYASETWTFNANWKLIVEGALEAYHFRVAHRDTIAPLFLDNLSSYQCFGNHIRSVLPRSHLSDLADKPNSQWSIRADTNVIYTLFPTNQFLVQEDHIVWIQLEPLAADRTRLRLCTVVPEVDLVPEREAYWRKHHELTVRTLSEDFAIGEGIQKGLASGANTHLNFGRFEGALDQFNQALEREMQA